MEPRANYALIGAFVIFAAVALMGFTLWLGQNQFRQSFDEYDIVFEGPVTLEEGASVRYIGIKVGEVRWVRIDRSDPSKVRTRIRIDSETPVKVDSTANIDFAGITGITFVQINAGKATSPPLDDEADDARTSRVSVGGDSSRLCDAGEGAEPASDAGEGTSDRATGVDARGGGGGA